jgi:methylenetetrahydrofolate reductase (NADPH)
MKITDKISTFAKQSRPFYSFEYFPPKTDFGLENLYSRMERMANLEPAFVDITWGAGGSTADLTLEMSGKIQKFFGLDVMMHLTCVNMTQESILDALKAAKSHGIKNILALRGDAPQSKESSLKTEGDFHHAKDLVAFIRKNFKDEFSIGVAGYPEAHQESGGDWRKDAHFLKEKVDHGADFVITQLFYDAKAFLRFRDYSREIGIKVPIIPGIMPIHNYSRFIKFTEFCGVAVPDSLKARLEPIKSDDSKVMKLGVDHCVEVCEELLEAGVPGIHFYTLNLENSVTEVLVRLKLTEDSRERKAFPWRQATIVGRQETEEIRPIYWSNRTASYLARTSTWDDFPNGRWGDSRSPTFGELSDYHLLRSGRSSAKAREERREIWGEPKNEKELYEVFANYCLGKVDRLPWSDVGLQAESGPITDTLVSLNRAGFLTINSQPQVNGAPSTHPSVGWGGPGGFVFQKAYLEFFTTPAKWKALKANLKAFPSMTWQVVDFSGDYDSNMALGAANAVTWGVFPGKEIVQPTVVDTASFKIWREEAFDLWLNDWAYIYEQNSESRMLFEKVHNTYVLVNIVENDFVSGDLNRAFQGLI